MNLFNLVTLVCTAAGIAVGIRFGSSFGVAGGIFGATVGGIGGLLVGPLFGVLILLLAHLECVITGKAPLFGKSSDQNSHPVDNDASE